jgi:hypothetical protein
LEELFKTDAQTAPYGNELIKETPPITTGEVSTALRHMAAGKAQDDRCLIMEMFRHGGISVHKALTDTFSKMLANGKSDPSCKQVLFMMLPKPGNAKQLKNWRPIAILRVTYKIFTRVLHERLQPILDLKQSPDQVGFRRDTSSLEALLVSEVISGKILEWSLGLWAASVDLIKVFDRVEHAALFEALCRHGLSESYVALLAEMYDGQVGGLRGSK